MASFLLVTKSSPTSGGLRKKELSFQSAKLEFELIQKWECARVAQKEEVRSDLRCGGALAKILAKITKSEAFMGSAKSAGTSFIGRAQNSEVLSTRLFRDLSRNRDTIFQY